MKRYINAGVFANSLRQFCKDVYCGNAEQRFSLDQIIGALELQPTADVREVTLCKNCKYASPYRIEGTIFCEDSGCPNLEDGFCNHAERGDE